MMSGSGSVYWLRRLSCLYSLESVCPFVAPLYQLNDMVMLCLCVQHPPCGGHAAALLHVPGNGAVYPGQGAGKLVGDANLPQPLQAGRTQAPPLPHPGHAHCPVRFILSRPSPNNHLLHSEIPPSTFFIFIRLLFLLVGRPKSSGTGHEGIMAGLH